MYQPLIFSYLTTYVARDVVFYTITTISTSIISIQNINKFITEHKDSEYRFFHNNIEKTDLIHKLNLTNVLIKDIIKSHTKEKDKIDLIFDKIGAYNEEIESENNKISNEEEFSIISKNNEFDKIDINLPEPVKIAIVTTLEIIHKINYIFEKIHKKMIDYKNSYFNIYKLNIINEVNEVIHYNDIFNKRLNLMIKIIDIYKNKI